MHGVIRRVTHVYRMTQACGDITTESAPRFEAELQIFDGQTRKRELFDTEQQAYDWLAAQLRLYDDFAKAFGR